MLCLHMSLYRISFVGHLFFKCDEMGLSSVFTVKTVQYVVLGPRKSPMPMVHVFSENDKIFCQEKKYVE